MATALFQQEASTPEDKCAEFRAIVKLKAGYVSSVLFGLVPYFVKDFGTMAVTKGLVHIIDPVWIMQFNEFEGAFLYMHEINHVIRATADRCGDRDHKIFNMAADIPINDDLIAAGWTPPQGANAPLRAATFGFPLGLSTEEYYDLLIKKKQKDKGKSPEDVAGRPHLCSGQCGGTAGNPSDIEEQADKEVGRSVLDRKGIQQQAIEDIRRHVGQGRGTVPAGLKSLLGAIKKKSKVPWRRKFASFLRRSSGKIQSGGMDFSLSRPSRGSYSRGIPRPGLVQQEPEIAFIEDTSGSMGVKQLKIARREARAVMASIGIEQVWWLDADAAVAAKPRRVGIRDLEHLPVHGGGGTDFRPAIETCLKLRPRPDIIIYLTDGDGVAPDVAPPGVTVIWCIVPSYYNKRPAKWGHAVIMRDEGDEREYSQFADEEDEDDDP
jgi:predicted metal-dependent peptidase